MTQSVNANVLPRDASAKGSMFSSTSTQPLLCSVLLLLAAISSVKSAPRLRADLGDKGETLANGNVR